jgi:hypothetical protein
MSSSVITVEHLGKKYRLQHQAQRQRYTALRDVLADATKSVARRLWSLTSVFRPLTSGSSPSPLSSLPSSRSASEDFWGLRPACWPSARALVPN